MAIAKTFGIETEYGIVHRGTDDPNPITASSLLINSFLASEGYKPDARSDVIAWDFIDETPGAMHEASAPRRCPGGRDPSRQCRPSQRRPLLRRPRPSGDVDPGGRRPTQRRALRPSRRTHHPTVDGSAAELLPAGQELVLYKNNSDGKGNSYGTHENYLVSRDTPFGRIVRHCTAHFITREIFTGAGKVGAELPGQRTDEVHYQLTQRADFFEEEVGLETTLKRPIINTRDEPHADARKYRRLHVIVGDANPSQVATFLKVGTTALVLAMVEDDLIRMTSSSHHRRLDAPREPRPHPPRGPSARRRLDDRRSRCSELLDLAKEYVDRHGTDATAARPPMRSCAAGNRCWPASNATRWSSPTSSTGSPNSDSSRATANARPCVERRQAAMDIQYTDMRPDKGLAWRVGLEQLVLTPRRSR